MKPTRMSFVKFILEFKGMPWQYKAGFIIISMVYWDEINQDIEQIKPRKGRHLWLVK